MWYGNIWYGVCGTEAYGTEACGTEAYGTDACGTETYGTEAYGTEAYGTEAYGTEQNSTTAEEVARFQRLFPNLSLLTSGRTSGQ